MIDSSFDPFDELIASRSAIVSLEQVVKEVVEVTNAQARVLEDCARNQMDLSHMNEKHTRQIASLNADLKLCRTYINQLESQVNAVK